jgi:hypothetical protein
MPEAAQQGVRPATAAVAAPDATPAPAHNAQLSRGACGSVRHVERLVDLVSIFEPRIQVLVQQRAVPPEIATYLDDPAIPAVGFRGFRQVVDVGTDLPGRDLPKAPHVEALQADIGRLVEFYADLLGCTQIGLRLEGLQRTMCPGWHCDRTGIRLLCTYRGPGTEWLEGTGLDRTTLPGSVADRPPDGSAGAGDIVLLKGSLWQGNAGWGAIHRSPAPGRGTRWLLALDAIW